VPAGKVDRIGKHSKSLLRCTSHRETLHVLCTLITQLKVTVKRLVSTVNVDFCFWFLADLASDIDKWGRGMKIIIIIAASSI